jgi:adenine-specific DNA glycosylase
MKRCGLLVTVSFVLMAFASAEASILTTQRQVDNTVAGVNEQASRPQGSKVVAERLAKEFNVPESEIQALRSKGLGYGEAGIVLSLASKLPGGITDANIKKILALRNTQPRTGWGKIARELGFKLGQVIRPVREVAEQSRAQLDAAKDATAKDADTKQDSREAKADWSSRHDRPERPERPQAMQWRH